MVTPRTPRASATGPVRSPLPFKERPRARVAETCTPSFPWRAIVCDALLAARAVVTRLAPGAGQRVVARRAAGYRSWDPEVIGVDTATERAVISALRRRGVRGTLLSEEAGEIPLAPLRGVAASEAVSVILDPFDGSLLYRRGIPAHWFTALGIYGGEGEARAAGLIDHLTGEIVLADTKGAVRLPRAGARPVPIHPSRTTSVDGACLEAYMKKPSFLYPTSTALRPLFERALFILPNGGPGGFVDVAAGRIDVYLAWNEALTEVYSAAFIAERAGCVITCWDGSPVRFTPDVHAVYSLVCSANAALHRRVLRVLRGITPPKGL
jgi:fructose-1,6-bisphosphatase/inositol monophosphatase family enzyme